MTPVSPPATWDRAQQAFPATAQPALGLLLKQGGVLYAAQWQALAECLEMVPEMLMVRLLPLARAYARAPISDFRVGAVVLADLPRPEQSPALFVGANLEFRNHPLTATLHAEQAALLNAWHHNAHSPRILAVSETPCGFCRQFMHELAHHQTLTLLVADDPCRTFSTYRLEQLLPQAIGPQALGMTARWMAPQTDRVALQPRDARHPGDSLAQTALQAARMSHAPYSGNLAGVAMETRAGRIFSGRYMETMAFNPCCSPLQAALLAMALNGGWSVDHISRAVLVEKTTQIEQYGVAQTLLKSVAPDTLLQRVPFL